MSASSMLGLTTLRRNRVWRLTERQRLGCLLVAPIVLWLVLVLFYPLGYVITLSLFKQETAGAPLSFVGLEFFKNLLLHDKSLWPAIHLSLNWTVGNIVVQFIAGIALALFLQRPFPGSKLVRLWVIVPWITPVVVSSLVWRWMLNPTSGVIEAVLRDAGLLTGYINLLGKLQTIMPTLVGLQSWRYTPFVGVVVLGRLLAIPDELYEAAKVDGASAVQRFIYITFPSIRGLLVTLSMLATIWTFTTFDFIYLMTGGGPVDLTTTMPLLVYKRAFRGLEMNQAAALSVVMFIIAVLFIMVYTRAGEKE